MEAHRITYQPHAIRNDGAITASAACSCGWTSSRTSVTTPRPGSTRSFDNPRVELRRDVKHHLAHARLPGGTA